MDAPGAAPQVKDVQSATHHECLLLSRYLLGVAPEPPQVDLYSRALATLAVGESPALAWARRFPFLIGLLDGGCGLVRRDDPLRRRLLILAAILEASPQHADRFLPAPSRLLPLILLAGCKGAAGVLKAIAGVPLVLLAEWAR